MAAVASLVAAQVTAANQRRDQIAQVARQHLRGTRSAAGIELPLVADITLEELGVHRAVLAVPYIRRDQEVSIRKLLEAGEPVLLVGSSMVGKTMTAASVIKDLYRSKRIVAPDSKGTLAAIDSADFTLRETVIWLDDINFLIGADGITDTTLRRLVAEKNTVIATIRALAYDRYMPASDVQSPEWDALKIFKRVFLDRGLSTEELERIADAVSDDVIKERISRIGLGEYVGAAEQIEESLRMGRSVSPVGYAMVRGATDWRRAGIDRAVPGRLLADLASPYLDDRKRYELRDTDLYIAALKWATHKINEEVSLLQKADRDSFVVFDYVLDLLSAKSEEFPTATWSVVMDAAEPAELLHVGYTAWVTHEMFGPAFEAWSKAAESNDPNVAPKALFNIAHILQFEKQTDEAEAMYELAIGSGDKEISALALTDLGYMKFKDGNIRAAENFYERVLDDADNQWAIALTHLRLGMLSEMAKDLRQAHERYEKAQESGFYELMPQAQLGLAHVELQDGRPLPARAHLQKAMNSGHPIYAPIAAFELAHLLITFNQVEEACDTLRFAMNVWNDDVGPPAAGLLGQILESAGQVEGARAAYSTAFESGHAEAAPAAAILLGKIMEQQGELDAALVMYYEAMKYDIEELVAEAAANIERLTGK